MRGARALLVAVLLCGCAGLRPGPQKRGLAVDEEGAAATRPEAVALAERRAVAGLFGLFVSSAARAADGARLERDFLAAPRVYVRQVRVLSEGPAPEGVRVRARCLVRVDRLAADLEAAGLVRPEGVYGSPTVLLSIREEGPGAGTEVGTASDALRRRLASRGFRVRDASDRMEFKVRRGSPEGGLAQARAAGASVLFVGTAAARPVSDGRLEGYRSCVALLKGKALDAASGASLGEVEAEATAVDLSPAGAAAKALENAGDLAAERLAAVFGDRFRERSELDLSVRNIGDAPAVVEFLERLRALPGVAGAAVSGLARRDVRLRVFVEKVSADELAALLLRLPGRAFEVRLVDSDYGFVEVEAREGGS